MKISVIGTLPGDFGISKTEVRSAAAFFAERSRARVDKAGQACFVNIWHEVVVHLVRDVESDAVHRAIMGIAGATDVITQAYDAIPPEEPGIYGELFVNVDQVRRAAPRRKGWSYAKELLLYIAHGMDHLSGADDGSPADYARMRRRELAWLRQHKEMNAGFAGGFELKSGRIPDKLEDAI